MLPMGPSMPIGSWNGRVRYELELTNDVKVPPVLAQGMLFGQEFEGWRSKSCTC